MATMTTKPTPEHYPARYIAPYAALPWQVPAWRDKSPVLLFSGSAGGGKSRLAGEKLHGFCLKYSGATALMMRKTRQSMTNSTVLFMERVVIGRDSRVRHLPSKNRFEYDNGSVLAYGGMADEEQREAIRSIGVEGGLDIVWMEEATRFEESDFQEVAPRMRGKAAGWAQVILSTNPDGPNHWINQRLIVRKEAHVYYSGALDNPHNPPEYANWLNMLTGVMRLRLVDGKWVQAEGAVYDNFEPEHNVTDAADYNPAWGGIQWGVDDGYAYGQGPGTESYHPRVVLVGQLTPTGGLNIFAEYYRCGVAKYDDTIDEVLALGYPAPELAHVDSSAAMLRGALSNQGIPNVGATHEVAEGIKNLRQLICDGQQVRRLQIHPRCTQLVNEMQSYLYSPRSNASKLGERRPQKLDDHGPDALRYMAWPLRWNPGKS